MHVRVGKARLKNKSQFPTEELVKLTRFVLDFLECKRKVKIVVANAREDEGLECDGKINVWLPKSGWPRSGNTETFKNFPHYLMRTWQEGYVVILAHELVHAMGAPDSRGGEWLCEITACAALLTYRSVQ